MKKMVIIGAGGMAKVYFDILKDEKGINIVGFADDDITKKEKKICSKDVYVPISSIKEKFKDIDEKYFVVTIGNNIIRDKIFTQVKNYGFKPVNVIHKEAHISSLVEIGDGNLIEAGVGINPDVVIKNNCIISLNASIGHDCVIGNSVHISPNVSLGGGATLEDYVDMGLNSCVLPNVKVGKNSIIGAGAVVTKNIPPNVVAVGIPAKVIKKIDY